MDEPSANCMSAADGYAMDTSTDMSTLHNTNMNNNISSYSNYHADMSFTAAGAYSPPSAAMATTGPATLAFFNPFPALPAMGSDFEATVGQALAQFGADSDDIM